MFKVRFVDVDYEVRFQYEQDEQGRRLTECTIVSPVSGVQSVGQAVCSKKDRFVRVEGRKLALQRALEIYNREFRTAVWNQYKQVCKQ